MRPYSHHLLDLLQPKPTKQHDAQQFRLLDVQLALLVFTSIVTALSNLQWFHAIVNLNSSCQQPTGMTMKISHIDPPRCHLVKRSTCTVTARWSAAGRCCGVLAYSTA